MKKNKILHTDYVLIGGGIMSATLASFLQILAPNKRMLVLEKMDQLAAESSSAWNNAGTGHAANCELNYTPQTENGEINISKAVKIHAQFEESKQFWSYLLNAGFIDDHKNFINQIPHMSFVYGGNDVSFLEKRYEALKLHPFFSDMIFSNNFEEIKSWAPLLMENRNEDAAIAATKVNDAYDVNFGTLSETLFKSVSKNPKASIKLNSEIVDMKQLESGIWNLKVHDLESNDEYFILTRFVFIGAGGGALHLLEKSDIEEAEGYGGFPVSGQWLMCTNQDVINRHNAKVYGQAKVGAPPMSVPHLDTRRINGEKALFFGPFAGFTTKFLKNGSYMDLIKSIEVDNIFPMVAAGWHNLKLTKYLIDQVRMSFEDRMEALREYYPDAKNEDWEIKIAGQRVQVIKKDAEAGGVLEFGTELICHADGSLAALLGASPGASTAVTIILQILEKCFPEAKSEDWIQKISEMIPYRHSHLVENPGDIIKSRAISNLNLEMA